MADYMYDLDSPRETYAAALKTYHENKYILEEKIDTNDSSTLRSVIMNFYNEYAFLIIVSIPEVVCDELYEVVSNWKMYFSSKKFSGFI